MNPGIVILIVVCGWSLLSILVALGFGDAAKARDRFALHARTPEQRDEGARRSA